MSECFPVQIYRQWKTLPRLLGCRCISKLNKTNMKWQNALSIPEENYHVVVLFFFPFIILTCHSTIVWCSGAEEASDCNVYRILVVLEPLKHIGHVYVHMLTWAWQWEGGAVLLETLVGGANRKKCWEPLQCSDTNLALLNSRAGH